MIDAQDIDPKAVARRVRTQMQLRDVTTARLAASLGVSALRVEEIVFGRTVVGPMMIRCIASGLRCDAEYLMTGKVKS